jgi:hypothetical protein
VRHRQAAPTNPPRSELTNVQVDHGGATGAGAGYHNPLAAAAGTVVRMVP